MSKSLMVFIGLQIADLTSTLYFLSIGIHEGNPLVRMMMHIMSPLMGLLFVKFFAVLFGLEWYWRGRSMKWVNIFFAFLFFWNLLAIYGTPKALLYHT